MDWTDVALRLGAAALLGALIGLDRELRHKSAGVRTISLVTLGTAVAVLAATGATADSAASSRVIQGALAGLGFLGGGVIVHHRHNIEGLTTAAAIWTSAALGGACGMGLWPLVAIGGGLMLVLLIVAGWLESRLGQTKH
ncbi:MgtC/SapB family protein [Rhizomicrobium electricum]|uniref:Protein MgtC n=1 Tax=Rhizomicrobium electricum TaxID=480070 RepID=A0ABN1EJJ3_9PROT|nr:MgtC/SapB family protein [Rhizomicrobium electricum]NIJ48396.1 putative Mg2+ transporter-C (MgtC) family protein [Rhizomicrobium electricum]